MKLKTNIFIAIFTLILTSCFKEEKNAIVINSKDFTYRPFELTGPIAKIHVPLGKSLEKYLDIDELFIDNEDVVCIRYVTSDTIEWSDDIGLRGYSNNWSVPFVVAGGLINKDASFKVNLNSSDESDSYVNTADLTSGYVSFTLTGVPATMSGNITMRIPGLTKGGVVFSQTVNLSSVTPNRYPLAGYRMETDNNNDLNIQFSLINATGSSSGNFNIQFTLSEMEVSYLSGYFGTITTSEENEREIDFFDEFFFDGVFGFKDVKMDVTVRNKVGAPINSKADVFFANDFGMNERLGFIPPLNFTINGATSTSTPTMNSFSTTLPVIEFNGKTNYPKTLRYEVDGTINPDGKSGNVTNFIVKDKDNSLAEVEFTLTLPMHIKVEEFRRVDMVDFDYNDIVGNDADNINNVEYVHITLLVDNGLPFDITLGAEVENESKTYTSSILSGTNITAKTYGQNILIEVPSNQLENFRINEVKNIILYTTAKTQNEDYVKVKDTDFLDVNVYVHTKASIPSNIFD